MLIFKLLSNRIGGICIVALIAFIGLMWSSNSKLKHKQEVLTITTQDQAKTIEIQKKVIAVVKETRSTSLAGNIKRMQNGDL